MIKRFFIAVAVCAPTLTLASVPLTAKSMLKQMSPGINLGNTLEAIPTATSWGNPPANLAYFKALRAAGFKSVRVPVAYSQYSDPKHTIKPSWMAQVKGVVDMARKADLYVMINVHWDGGWLQPTYKDKPAATIKLKAFWNQIAKNFKNYDDHLLFAGTNEVMVTGDYGAPKPEYAEVQNSYNQAFVDTVRATGGKNASRWLVVQGFNTNIDHTVKENSKMPRDKAKGRLMMEVHHYSPYNFTLNEKSDIWQWGAGATDPKATETWANEAYVDAQFLLMKKNFVDKGVPVILGEYCADLKPKYPGMRKYQMAWNEYVTRSAFKHQMVPMFWDIGLAGGLFNRTTGKPQHPDMIKLIVSACK